MKFIMRRKVRNLWWLIVDDGNDAYGNVESLSAQLKSVGYAVERANLSDAAEWNRTLSPAFIHMDDLGDRCVSLYEKLHRDNPNATFFTCSYDVDVLAKAADKGMRIFQKPMGYEGLVDFAKGLLED